MACVVKDLNDSFWEFSLLFLGDSADLVTPSIHQLFFLPLAVE